MRTIKRIIICIVLFAGMVACNPDSKQGAAPDLRRIQDSLTSGNYEVARQLINSKMVTAPDSDTFYRWLSIMNSAWFAEMNTDSMVATSQRIHQYLLRHQQESNKVRQLIWAEWLKARGVYFSTVEGLPDSALAYTEQALKMMNGLNDIDDLRLIGLSNRAYFYQQKGVLDMSADCYLKALEAADSMGKSEQAKPALMLGISTVYTFMGDYINSAVWWEKTRELLPKMVKADQFIYYNNRGNDYYFQQQYPEARDCFNQASKIVKDDEGKAWDYYMALANLGEVYVCLERADSARMMIEQADSFFRKVDFTPSLYYIETSKIELEVLEGHTDRAMQMIRNSQITAPSVSAKVLRLKAIEQVMKLTDNYREAYNVSEQIHTLNDSIQANNVRMQFSSRLLGYEHDKRLMEQRLTLEKAKEGSRLAWALNGLVMIVAILLFCLFIIYRRRQQIQRLLAHQQITALRMENIRNRITPHFIYNALTHETLAQLEGRKVDLGTLTQLLRKGVEQADMMQATLAEELAFIDYYVEIEGRQIGPDFHFYKDISTDVDTKTVILPAMIVQVFVENALKHGLRTKKCPPHLPEGQRKLTIRISRIEESTLIEVIDNGQGLQQPVNKGGIGIQLIRQTIELLNERNENRIAFGVGNWQENGESGCRSWIKLPDHYNYDFKLQTNK